MIALLLSTHLVGRERAFELSLRFLRTFLSDALLHILLEAYALEQVADHIKHLVGAQLAADAFELFEQGLEHAPLARLASDQIDDPDLMALLIAVDAPHPL